MSFNLASHLNKYSGNIWIEFKRLPKKKVTKKLKEDQ